MDIQDIEYTAQECVLEKGYFMKGRLPDERIVVVEPLTFGRARLGIGPRPPFQEMPTFASTWEFSSPDLAFTALMNWASDDKEPTGWDRHPDTRRYRIDGDPELEYVKIDTGRPLKEEIQRAVWACNGGEKPLTIAIEETRSAYALDGPVGTKSFVVSWSHDVGGRPCHHIDCALVYLDRCIILVTEDMVQLVKGLRSAKSIRQRLVGVSHKEEYEH